MSSAYTTLIASDETLANQTGIGLNLLCLDGGGIRGLSSLYILKQLMELIDINNPPRPCQCFDMIGGTSTGGLVAIMLGRLGMTVDQCITAYEELSPKIFTKLHHRLKINGKLQGRFDHKAIEVGVKELLRGKGIEEELLMYDETGESCKTFVCATSKQISRTVVFSSYLNPMRGRDMADITKIWQAARATSAATSFFDPIKIADEEFVDGATPSNNPIMELWSEASQVFQDRDIWKLEDNISCLVSIGAGVPALRPFGDDPLAVGSRLVQITTDTEKTARDFLALHPALYKNQRYFRFNVSNGLQDVKLEDEDKRPLIKAATRDYTQSLEVNSKMQECSRKLFRSQMIMKCFQNGMSHAKEVRRIVSQADQYSGSALESDLSSDLGWFTHTQNYRLWVRSKCGYILYPMRAEDADTRVKALAAGLPMMWRREFLEDSTGETLFVTYFDCNVMKLESFEEFLLLITCQLLLFRYGDTVDTLLGASPELKPDELQYLNECFSESFTLKPEALLKLLSLLKERITESLCRDANCRNFKFLVILANLSPSRSQIFSPSRSQIFAEALISRKSYFTEIGAHILVTGSGWRSDIFPIIDEDTEYKECLASLAFEGMHTRRNQVESGQIGTGHWVWNHPSFQFWNDERSGVLWIQGKPGSGKSVLAKSIITVAAVDSDYLTASWFYSKRAGTVGSSHEFMMRSISHQLLSQSRSLFDKFAPEYRVSGLNLQTLAKMLKLSQSKIFCLLDAFDESADRETYGKYILELLSEVTEHSLSRLKLVILTLFMMARRTLAWVLVASSYRPMRLKELLDAISITTVNDLHKFSSASQFPFERPACSTWIAFSRDLNDLCGPLIEVIDPSTGADRHSEADINACSVVQLLHQTVKEFLEGPSNHKFHMTPEDAHGLVKKDSYTYLHVVLPVQATEYTPVLNEIGLSSENGIYNTVRYFEDKFLLNFILAYSLTNLDQHIAIASRSSGQWWLDKFFDEDDCWNYHLDSAKETVAGSIFWISCTLGMDTAVENLLFLSSLRSGWWESHRDLVINGVAIATAEHNLEPLHYLVSDATRSKGGWLFTNPALRRDYNRDTRIKLLNYRLNIAAQNLRQSLKCKIQLGLIKDALPSYQDISSGAVQLAVCRVLHYLEGHMLPLDLNKIKGELNLIKYICYLTDHNIRE